MATLIRAQLSWQVGSMLPRDRFTNTVYFNHTLGLIEGAPEWQTLADDLKTAVNGWSLSPTNHELTVKLYDMGDAQPRRPKATSIIYPGACQEDNSPREIALCLSFSTAKNVPKERGRIYLPRVKISNAAPGVRPTSTERAKAGDLATVFKNLGGTNVDWVINSQSGGGVHSVYKWWVDDEWDTVRKRGLKSTTRTAGVIDE